MTNSGYNGSCAAENRSCNPFRVEGPQILERTPASRQQNEIQVASMVQALQSGYNAAGCSIALNRGSREHDFEQRPSPCQNLADVVKDSPGGRGNDTDSLRKARQWTLAGGGKKAFRLQLCPQANELRRRVPVPSGSTAST